MSDEPTPPASKPAKQDDEGKPTHEAIVLDIDPWRDPNNRRWVVPLLSAKWLKVTGLLVAGTAEPRSNWSQDGDALSWLGKSELPEHASVRLAARYRIVVPAVAVTAVFSLIGAVTVAYISKDCDRCVAPFAKLATEADCKDQETPEGNLRDCLKRMRVARTDLERKVTDLANAKESAEILAEDLQHGGLGK